MAQDYLKPMLDVGSPRVLNCNVISRRLGAENPEAQLFFRCKPLNKLVLIKDTDLQGYGSKASIGTKLYVPFNENDIYEGGRTVFVHDKMMPQALEDSFGAGALPPVSLEEDLRILRILDSLPSMDPFLLKDVFIREKIEMNPAYFDVPADLWDQIELYILQGFEPLARAAFPDAIASDEMARKLIEKIWEGRDLDALRPLIMALRLPKGEELEIFAAWKGVIFYGFQRQRTLPSIGDMQSWIQEIKIPLAAVSSVERAEIKAAIEEVKTSLQQEWGLADKVLKTYQEAYEKMFKEQAGSGDFVKFMQNSNQAYRTLGNSLGKVGHAVYCWDSMTKRYKDRKMPWEPTRELLGLFGKVFSVEKKAAQTGAW